MKSVDTTESACTTKKMSISQLLTLFFSPVHRNDLFGNPPTRAFGKKEPDHLKDLSNEQILVHQKREVEGFTTTD